MARAESPRSRPGAVFVSLLTIGLLALSIVTTKGDAATPLRHDGPRFAATDSLRVTLTTPESGIRRGLFGDSIGLAPKATGGARSWSAPPRSVPAASAPASAPSAPPAPPPPASAPPAAAPVTDPVGRAVAALAAGVPAAWRSVLPATVVLSADGVTASRPDNRIRVAPAHALGDWNRLVAIMAHEFGHLVAFHYGTHATLGAAPAGWPSSGAVPVEHWADCVSRALTAFPLASHGQAACAGEPLQWTAAWLAAGPNAHPRTG